MIRTRTDPLWVKTALEDFDMLLSDHAHCEKKAAATALSLVASYPEQDRLVGKLSLLAIEELRHFRAVEGLLPAPFAGPGGFRPLRFLGPPIP